MLCPPPPDEGATFQCGDHELACRRAPILTLFNDEDIASREADAYKVVRHTKDDFARFNLVSGNRDDLVTIDELRALGEHACDSDGCGAGDSSATGGCGSSWHGRVIRTLGACLSRSGFLPLFPTAFIAAVKISQAADSAGSNPENG
jgi:hypothetical protein